jgi:diacylglycerol kinase family enzyme
LSFNVRLTSDLGELSALATEGLESGDLRVVLAVGGDGTASVVRNHVPLNIPMLPVPMGTENLLGRYVSQSIEPADVCRTVAEGVVVGLDLGSANGKHFLLMVSAGFDAEVIRTLHAKPARKYHAWFVPAAHAANDRQLPLSANAAIF